MLTSCPHCGEALPHTQEANCPGCHRPLDDGSPPRTGPVQTEGGTPASLSADTQDKKPPKPPSWLIVATSVFFCAWAGAKITGTDFSFSRLQGGEIVGATLGLVIGLAVWLDDRKFQRMVDGQVRETPKVMPPPPASSQSPSEVVALVMLIIPPVVGLLIWQRQQIGLPPQIATGLGFFAILSTALLGYADARSLTGRTLRAEGRRGTALNPAMQFIGMLGMWVLCFPVYFIARRRAGARNFVLPALLGTVLFIAPTVEAFFSRPELPHVEAPEVVSLVVRVIEDSPQVKERRAEFGPIHITEPVEISFDPAGQKRVARAKLITNLGTDTIYYSVVWHDRAKGTIAIQVSDKP